MTYDKPVLLLARVTREWESCGRSSSRQRKNCFIFSNISEVTRCQTLEINGIQSDITLKSQHTENKQFELHGTKTSDLVFFIVKSPSDNKCQGAILIKMTASLYRC